MQMPEASVLVPDKRGSLPAKSGDVSMPSVGGGVDVNVAGPSAGVDVCLPSASGGWPGEGGAPGPEQTVLYRLIRRCLLSLADIIGARLDM